MGLMESISVIGSADGPTAVFLAGVVNTQMLVVSIVAGLILCIFGLRLMRLLSAIIGGMLGAGIGAVIVALAGLEGPVSLAVILGAGLVFAVVSFFVKRVGAFLSVLCYVSGALLAVIPGDSVIILIVSGVAAIILAVLAAIYLEPLVVVVSSIAGGLLAGPAIASLVGMGDKIWIGLVIALVLAIAGVPVQLLMQSNKIKDSEKKHSQKVKEKDSRESDVEKARNILDDDTLDVIAEEIEEEMES